MLTSTSQGRSYRHARLVPAPIGVSFPDPTDTNVGRSELATKADDHQTLTEEQLQANQQILRDIEEWNAASGQSGQSWKLPHQPPALVWTSRQQWDLQVSVAVHTSGLDLLRSRRIPLRTFMAISRACAALADSQTGRSLTASTATIGRRAAQIVGRPKPFAGDTVTRCRRILACLGMAVECARGRYLTIAERQAATIHHGGLQHRAASVWALISPKHIVTTCSDLPRRGHPSISPSSSKSSPKRARTRAAAPSGRHQQPRPLQDQRVAAKLAALAPGLAPRGHIGSLVDALTDLVDTERWNAHDLVELLSADTRKRGWTWPDHINSPVGFLRRRLRDLREDLAGPSPSDINRKNHQRQLEAQQRRREADQQATKHVVTAEQRKRHVSAITEVLRAARRR